jgi:hypothetical protein
MAETGAAREPRSIRAWLMVIVIALVAGALTWRGYDYYRQALDARAAHADYRLLNPAGLVGHGYGMVGTAMIATNLLYLVRRRFAKAIPDWLGSVKAWLHGHVFTGLVGSLLIVFHSAFQLRTPIATVTSVSLGVVVVTGLVGLYLYALMPKAGLQPLKARLAHFEPLLPGMAARVTTYLNDAPVTRLPADASFVRAMVTLPRWLADARTRRRGVAKAARGDKLLRVVERNDPAFVRHLVTELGDLAASEIDTNAGAALMRTWRSFHRFLALLMLVSVSVHIAVAWYYGFRWIFS